MFPVFMYYVVLLNSETLSLLSSTLFAQKIKFWVSKIF